jgi:hypothetical protein
MKKAVCQMGRPHVGRGTGGGFKIANRDFSNCRFCDFRFSDFRDRFLEFCPAKNRFVGPKKVKACPARRGQAQLARYANRDIYWSSVISFA